MSGDELNLGDLPDDIGTDHNQLIDVPPGVVTTALPGQRKKRPVQVPAWSRWLAGILVPNLFPALRFTGRPFSTQSDSFELSSGKSTRRYLLIQNNSIGTLYLNFDNDASASNGVKIPPGGYYEPLRVPQNSLYIIGDSAGLVGFLVEG